MPIIPRMSLESDYYPTTPRRAPGGGWPAGFPTRLPTKLLILAVSGSVLAHGAGMLFLGMAGDPSASTPLVDVSASAFVSSPSLLLAPESPVAPDSPLATESRSISQPAPDELPAAAETHASPALASEVGLKVTTNQHESAQRSAPTIEPQRGAPSTPATLAQPFLGTVTPIDQPSDTSFAGVEGIRADRVVYVVDGSGPMTSCFPFVRAELEDSVSNLQSHQSFQIIVSRRRVSQAEAQVSFFRGESGGFVPNDPRVREGLHAWMAGVRTEWASDPMAGLEAALLEKPDLIFLLTRSIQRSAVGDVVASNNRTLSKLDALNPVAANGRRAVVIRVIQFLDEDPTGLLQRIAETHGDGTNAYRVLKSGE